jgi:hypothetical protein
MSKWKDRELLLVRFHTTLVNRIGYFSTYEAGFNAVITLTLLEATAEEPRFRKLPPSPFSKLEALYDEPFTAPQKIPPSLASKVGAIYNQPLTAPQERLDRIMKKACDSWYHSPGVRDVFDEFINCQADNFGREFCLANSFASRS